MQSHRIGQVITCCIRLALQHASSVKRRESLSIKQQQLQQKSWLRALLCGSPITHEKKKRHKFLTCINSQKGRANTVVQSLLQWLKQARHSDTPVRYFMVWYSIHFLWSRHTDFNLMYMRWKKKKKASGHDPLTTWPHSHVLRAHNECDIFALQKDPPNLLTALWLGVDFFRII